MLNIGNSKIVNLYCGTSKISKAYLGSTLVYQKTVKTLDEAIEIVQKFCTEIGENWYFYRGSSSDGRIDEDETYYHVTVGTMGSNAVIKYYIVEKTGGKVSIGPNWYNIGSINANDVVAALYSNGLLKITGNGTMSHWVTPNDIKPLIKEVHIGDGVKGVDLSNIFENCINLEKINKLPDVDSNQQITPTIASAFKGCLKLKDAPDILLGWGFKFGCFSGCYNLSGDVNVFDVCDPSVYGLPLHFVADMFVSEGYLYPIYVNYTRENKTTLTQAIGGKYTNIYIGKQLD